MWVYGRWQSWPLRHESFLFSSKHSNWNDQANLELHSTVYYRAVSKRLSQIIPLGDWLKNREPFFQPMKSKPKLIAPSTRDFSRALSDYVYLGIKIGPSRCLLLLWLAGVIILILVFRQSFENRSMWLSFTLCAQKNDCYLLEITLRKISWFLVFASRSQRWRTASRLIQWFTVISLALFSRSEVFVGQNSYTRAHRWKED